MSNKTAKLQSGTNACRPVVELIVCETCASAGRESVGRTGGARLLEHLRRLRPPRGSAGPIVRPQRCLWACKRSCAVHIRSAGRTGYVLADLEPSEESARALLAYAELYARSDDGSVPFRHWPDGVRGHFLCRVPAIGLDPEETT